MKNGKLLSVLFIVFAAVLITFNFIYATSAFTDRVVKAEATEEELADGKYNIKVTNDMPMGKSNISGDAVLEKNGNLCYLTLTFKRTSIDNPELKIDGKNAGQVITSDGDKYLSVTYTLSYENVFTPLRLTVYVVPMKTTKTVAVTADKSTAVKTGEFDTSVKRAPEFVSDDETIKKRDHSSDMPMWGYALILLGAVVVLAGVVVTIIVAAKRKKRMKKL